MSRYYIEGTIDRIIINCESLIQFSLVPSETFCLKENDKEWLLFLGEEKDDQRKVSARLREGTKFSLEKVDGLLLLELKRNRQHIRVYVTDPTTLEEVTLLTEGLEIRD